MASAYAELYFTDVLWPDFDEVELNKALGSYTQSTRRIVQTGELINQKQTTQAP